MILHKFLESLPEFWILHSVLSVSNKLLLRLSFDFHNTHDRLLRMRIFKIVFRRSFLL